MSIEAGTPTVFDKAKADLDAVFGKVTPQDQIVLAGQKQSLDNALSALENMFGPVVKNIEADALSDVTKFLQGIAAAIPVGSVTSLSEVVKVVTDAAKDIGGPIATQIGQIESSALNTLVSAASVAAGHTTLSVN